jgi:hypothetical protein
MAHLAVTAPSSTEGEARPPRLTASLARAQRARGSRVGRLELHYAIVCRPRSGSYRKAELRFLQSLGDRFCPWLSIASPTVADPARTKGSAVWLPFLSCSVATTSACMYGGRCCHLRGRGTAQVEAASLLSVVVRSGPVETVVNGTLVARPPGLTPLSGCAVGSAITGGWGPSSMTAASLARARTGSRQIGH